MTPRPAEHVNDIEDGAFPAERRAEQKSGPEAPFRAVALAVNGEARDGVRGGGEHFREQPRRQARRQADDMLRGRFFPHAAGEPEHMGRGGPPVAVGLRHESRAGKRPCPVQVREQGQGLREILETDEADAFSAVVKILNERLALQKVAQPGQVHDDDVTRHCGPLCGSPAGSRHAMFRFGLPSSMPSAMAFSSRKRFCTALRTALADEPNCPERIS